MDVEDVESFVSEDLVGEGECKVLEIAERSKQGNVCVSQVGAVLESECV